MRHILSLLSILSLIISINGCNDCVGREMVRITSPDGKYDALLIEQNCGGAIGGSFDYEILIVNNGKRDKGEFNL